MTELAANRGELQKYQVDLEDMVATRTVELQRALQSEREIVAQQRDFTAMIGHEFRTPLAVIDGQARRIARADGGEDDLIRRAREIHGAVHDMIGLMDGLLFHARHDSGLTEYRFETIPVDDILRQAVDAAVPRSRVADVRITCPDGLLCRADRTLMATALGNLIGNAAKYSQPGTCIQIEAAGEHDMIEIRITDEGTGIAPAELEAVFARFQRGSNVLTTPGSGLGLFMARRIAEGHGGSITVASTLGHGSSFTVRLPHHRFASMEHVRGLS